MAVAAKGFSCASGSCTSSRFFFFSSKVHVAGGKGSHLRKPQSRGDKTPQALERDESVCLKEGHDV